MMSKERDLYQELRSIGLTHDQVSEVLKWVDTIPIHVSGGNIHVRVENGIVKLNQNKEDA
jgi:hypothetical protein